MKNRLTHIITVTLVLVIVVVFVMPNHAYALELLKYAGFPSPMDLLNSFLAYIVNAAVGIAGFLVTAAAHVLDTSIILTLHIRDFVDATPAIYTVWKTIRDITGLFFIFYLLYAAIEMILGRGSGSYGKTITNIVIAGILVNFSFFVVGIGIDASNVISQAIYNAMIPNQATVTITKGTTLEDLATQNPGKAKISNIFMNSLKIQTMYDTQGNKVGVAVSDPLKIILIGVAGVIMMITTAASFLLAAVAFIARLVILLFLLAFSPVLFLGSVLPELKTYTTQFTSTLKSQLTFMPAYLLLMYVALKILNESDLMGGANLMATGAPTGTNWALPYIVLGVNFTLVIIMLNLPLIAGLSMGGMATKVLGDKMGKWNALKVWGNVGGWAKNRAAGAGGWAGTNTIGRAASTVDKTLANTKFGNWSVSRDLRSVTTGAVAGSKFGGSRTWEDRTKIGKDVTKKSKEIDRQNDFRTALYNSKNGIPQIPNKGLGDLIGKMGEKEKLALGTKNLKDINILKHLKSSDFEAIKKSEDITDEDKKEIADARYDALKDAVDKNEVDAIKNMVNNMDGKDLMKMTKNKTSTLTDPKLVEHLKSSQLKMMEDEGLDSSVKKAIGDQIFVTLVTSNPHRAAGFITKNRVGWTT